MEEIIKNDPTLNYFVNEAPFDINNDFQLELKVASLKIALYKFIQKKY
jgi:hypothetical protein